MQRIYTEDIIKTYLDEIKKIDVIQDLHKMTWAFCLSTELWEQYERNPLLIDLGQMRKIKYFGKDDDSLSEEINELPEDSGGIYIYYRE